MRITQRPSTGHNDNHQQIPDFCACGGPILTAYRNADGFCCMACSKGGK